MWKLRKRKFRRAVGALAILGALLNAWVLTVHVTSVALTRMHASGGGIAICHQGEIKYVFLPDAGEKPISKKSCPICSGLASLHIGIINEPSLQTVRLGLVRFERPNQVYDVVTDHRPRQIYNRGPPLQV